MMSRRRRLRGPPSGVGVAYLALIQGQYDAMGIADKIAEVVLSVLLVVEGRRGGASFVAHSGRLWGFKLGYPVELRF